MTSPTPDLAPTKGPRVVRWIEKNCILGEGDYFGQPFRLAKWQKAFLYRLYELKNDGSRRYRRALLGLPKNNGKTPLAAAIAAYELLGGDHTAPVIPVAAASFEQADLVFGDLKVICSESPTLRDFVEVYQTEILLKNGPGRAYRVAAARGTNDGQRPTCFIADELHEWNDPAKEGAHLVLANGTTKRADSLQLNITTAGSDLESLLGRMYQHGKRVQAGQVEDDGFLFEWWEAPEGADIATDEGLCETIRACNPAADDFLRVDDVVGRFRQIPEFEGRRYFLNQWTRADECWLPPGAWEACEGDAEIEAGATCWVGIDFALRHDHVAVVQASSKDDRLAVRAAVWEPGANGIDIAAVEEHIRGLHLDFDVREFAYDPAYFERSAQALLDEGLPMLEFPQSAQRMVPACQNAYELIVSKQIIHDGDPVLTDHVLSAEPKQSSDRGWTLSKGRSRRKIDAAIAMVIALSRAHQPWDDTEPDIRFI